MQVSGSVMSMYSMDFGNVDIKGNIQFSIDYVEQLREFHVFVAQCKDLAVGDVKKQRSDPYVKSYLLPDKAKMGKRKTAVRKKTLNPSYNEILRRKQYKKGGMGERGGSYRFSFNLDEVVNNSKYDLKEIIRCK
ncbi:hypothetical protein FKM82_024201 [Ascaphus truei]